MIMTKSAQPRAAKTARTSARKLDGERAPAPAFPIGASEADADRAMDRLEEDNVIDEIDPDLRYRLISEAAYRRYAERGYTDGYDQDDWLQAEEQVEHFLRNRGSEV
jgi:hypothetical protein